MVHSPSTHSHPSRQQAPHPPVAHGSRPLGHPPAHSPSTHSSPSAQRLKQLPQWRSFLWRFTHRPLQQLWVDRHRLKHSPQWRSLKRRLTQRSPQRLCPWGHPPPSAQATPGKADKALPTRRPPINLRALPLEMLPLARALASSSKDWLVVCWLTFCPLSQRAGH
jgi:hypothetical protein